MFRFTDHRFPRNKILINHIVLTSKQLYQFLSLAEVKSNLVNLFHKLKKKFQYVIQFPWIVFLGIWLFFLSFKERVILRELRVDRVGHLIPDSFEQLYIKYDYRTFHFFGEGPKSNKYWCARMKKEPDFISGLGALVRIIVKFPRFKRIFFDNVIVKPSSEYKSRYYAHLPFDLRDRRIDFSQKENQIARSILMKNGVDLTRPILCLQVRNNLYLEKRFPLVNWDYHNFRNADISNFSKAIIFLIKAGYSVFRMGQFQENELKIESPHYHEFHKLRHINDFMDVWLYANSSRIVSTGSGPDGIATINNIPTLYINLLPLASFPIFANATVAPKILRWSKSGKILSLKEYWDSEWYFSENYTSNGVEIEELNEEQVLNCIKEWISSNHIESLSTIDNEGDRQLDELRVNREEYLHPNAKLSSFWLSLLPN